MEILVIGISLGLFYLFLIFTLSRKVKINSLKLLSSSVLGLPFFAVLAYFISTLIEYDDKYQILENIFSMVVMCVFVFIVLAISILVIYLKHASLKKNSEAN